MLKDDGVFLYVTYRQPHFIKPILNRNGEWEVEMEVMGGGDSFEYFGFVLRKKGGAAAALESGRRYSYLLAIWSGSAVR